MKTAHLPTTADANIRTILVASIACSLIFTACERRTTAGEPTPAQTPATQPAEPIAKTSTFETARLGTAINKFTKSPTAENQSSVQLAFAELNGEIAELEDRVVKTTGADRAEAAAKAGNLRKYRDSELIRFTEAQAFAAPEMSPPADSRSGTQKMKDTASKVGKTIEKGAENTGDAIKNATH